MRRLVRAPIATRVRTSEPGACKGAVRRNEAGTAPVRNSPTEIRRSRRCSRENSSKPAKAVTKASNVFLVASFDETAGIRIEKRHVVGFAEWRPA